MTDNRSERLRRRRKQSTARTNNQESTDDDSSSKPSKQDELSEPSGSTGSDDAETGGTASSDGDDLSIKEEQIGTYMYLPESQTKELRRQYNILKAEYEFKYDEEFEKNRHFYPLVVQHGLESLEKMDASDIRTYLEEIVD
jgi:hypothetical protein